MFECQNCGYYYTEQEERAPRCHYDLDDPTPAPCEYDDDYEGEDDRYTLNSYDDYEGEDDCYTLDDLGYNWY